jgi:hypothetical protein
MLMGQLFHLRVNSYVPIMKNHFARNFFALIDIVPCFGYCSR